MTLYTAVCRYVRRSYQSSINAHSGKNCDLFLLLDICSCAVLISYAPCNDSKQVYTGPFHPCQ
jgi:hypothetical protein